MNVGNQFVVVRIEPGQFVTGRKSGAEALGINQSTFYKRLNRLAASPYDFIKVTPHSNNLCTVVSICQWAQYQVLENESEHPKVATEEQPGNNRVTTEEQPGNTNNKGKNVENGKNREAGFPKEFADFLQEKTGGTWKNDLHKWRGEYGRLSNQVDADLPAVFKWATSEYRATAGSAKWFISDTWPKIWTAYNNRETPKVVDYEKQEIMKNIAANQALIQGNSR